MSELIWGYHIRPFPGERVSGDAAAMREFDDSALFAMVDGLGHGEQAHQAAITATRYVERHGERDLRATMTSLHRALSGTRGAAVGLCLITRDTGMSQYCGVGNIVIRGSGERSLGLFSYDGIVGQTMRPPRVQQYALGPDEVLILNTDGIPSRADVFAGTGPINAHPSTLARRVIQRYARASDDAGCVVIRYDP